MKSEQIVIQAEAGMHARPAGLLVKAAGAFESKITLEKDGKTADAKRLLGILSLAMKQGDTVTITVEGGDEEAAMEAVKEVIIEAK